MLKKIHRLKKLTDINSLHKNGSPFFTKLFVIKIQKNGLNVSRFVILISTKVHKHAVKRNRIRRIINGRLKDLINIINPGFDVMIIISKNIFQEDRKTIKKDDLIKSLNFGLEKTKLINAK